MERAVAYQRESPKIASTPGAQAAASNDATLTAASLIDAIITHQINQSSNPSGDASAQGANPKSAMVDNLFNRYRKTASPVDSRERAERHKEQQRQQDEQPPPQQQQQQRPPSSSPSVPSTTKAAFTLGEHIESIIAKDFHQSMGSGGEQDWEREWQRKQARLSAAASAEALMSDYKRTAAAMEYVAKVREGAIQDYAQPRGGEPDARQPGISPLDYVNKKIVEVMRTSSDGGPTTNHEQPSSPARRGPSPAPSPNKRPRMNEADERGGPSPMVTHFLSAYPTMSFSYPMPPNVPMSSASAGPPTSSASNQPHVVMAPQYEPLSEDED